MWWTSSCGRMSLNITVRDAAKACHIGHCDADVKSLSDQPYIRSQLDKLNIELVKKELQGYGAWDEDELSDHETNLQRLLWLACGDINEEIQ